jgi:hypothetical protein
MHDCCLLCFSFIKLALGVCAGLVLGLIYLPVEAVVCRICIGREWLRYRKATWRAAVVVGVTLIWSSLEAID